MATIDQFRKIALSFPEAEELPHFDKSSFRIKNKIFATLDEKLGIGMVSLSPIDQSVFCAFDKMLMYPVPGKWGLKGYTNINLKQIKLSMLTDALQTARDKITAPSKKLKN